jgi:serine/threonine-protein kinase
MPLSAGTCIGSYQIIAPLGAGGMGEVYRAKDTRLHRDVALKILPPAFMADPDRRARFAREAQVLAALNHPHIAGIYGFEDSSDTHALAMELVDGEDLSAIVVRGAIPLSDALQYARQIAEALEAAHEQGVVHRDLKPANVKVRADGTVKVLDFGLAKALAPAEGAGAAADAMTSPAMTQMGVVLGTAAYMAPEQAKGKAVDKRADIWAFGVVLYEMLTGRRLFAAEDISETLAAVLTRDVSLSSMPADIPARLRALLRDCLTRDPKQRLRDIGDARRVLDQVISGSPDDAIRVVSTTTPAASKGRMLPWAIAVVALLAVAVMGWQKFQGAPSAPEPHLMHVTLPFGATTGAYGVFGPGIAISRDGTTTVYAGEADKKAGLFVRRLDDPEPKLIRGSEKGSVPFLSPDGLWVGFYAFDMHIKKVSIAGGVPTQICDASDMRGASWGDDGFIVFTPNSQEGLWRVKDTGGEPPERLTTRDAAKHEKTHRLPDVLPNGKGVLFMIGTTEVESWNDATIAVLPPSGGPPKALAKGMMPRYVAPGYLVYAHGGDLVARPFDLDRLEVTGPEVSVASDIAMTYTDGAAEVAVSRGALAYLPGHRSVPRGSLIESDSAARTRLITHELNSYGPARWLPGQRRVLVGVDSGNTALFLLDTERGGSFTRLTFGSDATSWAWNRATGRAWFTGIGQIVSVAPEGGKESVVYEQQGFLTDLDVSPDGRFALFGEFISAGERLWMLNTATGKAEPWAPSRAHQGAPRFSPDGGWVAYVSNESGPPQVFVRAAHGSDKRGPVSAGPGNYPVWAPSGLELFYEDDKYVWVAEVSDVKRMEFAKPRQLFTKPERTNFLDVAPDGQHFLLLQVELPPAPSSITYISGWLELMKTNAGRSR